MSHVAKRTKTGNYLILIQGEGLGDGKPRAKLTVHQGGANQNEPTWTYQRVYHNETQKGLLARFLNWLGVA